MYYYVLDDQSLIEILLSIRVTDSLSISAETRHDLSLCEDQMLFFELIQEYPSPDLRNLVSIFSLNWGTVSEGITTLQQVRHLTFGEH